MCLEKVEACKKVNCCPLGDLMMLPLLSFFSRKCFCGKQCIETSCWSWAPSFRYYAFQLLSTYFLLWYVDIVFGSFVVLDLFPYMCCLCYMCVILNLITRLLHYLLPSCCEHLVWSLGQLVILRDVRSCTAVLLRSQLLLALFDPVNAHHDFWGKIIEKYSNSLEFTVAFIIDVNKFIRVEFSFSLHIHQLALKFSKDG